MLSIALAIFAKNPDVSPVKTRLAAETGESAAVEFYRLSVQATQDMATAFIAASAQDITPYWALAEQECVIPAEWQAFNTLWTGEGDLGSRLHHVYSALLQKHDAVLMTGTDSPALPTQFLLRAAELLAENKQQLVIGPAEDGGFYLFGGRRDIDKSIWINTPYSSHNTLRILREELHKHDMPVTLLPEHFDVDTKNDLLKLQNYLQHQTLNSPVQQKLIRYIEGLQLP
jgi:rSAM/selenodomain-associated transferase 1